MDIENPFATMKFVARNPILSEHTKLYTTVCLDYSWFSQRIICILFQCAVHLIYFMMLIICIL